MELEDETGGLVKYRIVGPDELDIGKGWISVDSPMARALLKRTLDDEISVSTPEGSRGYVIVDIAYD